jgi:signal transduction histidine kinase
MRRGSLRLRLLVAGAAMILVALAIAAAGLTLLFERHVSRWIDAELDVHLNQLAAGLDRNAQGAVDLVRPPADPRFSKPLSGLYWQIVLEGDGRTITSRSLWDGTIGLPAEASVDDEVHHYRVEGPAGGALYLLQSRIALDASELAAATARFARALAPFMLVIAVLLIAAAAAQVAVGLRPLAAVQMRLAAIRSGAERRLGTGFPEEVQPLAAEVDALLGARETQIESARARAADLAHGLKTPLQVLASDVAKLRAKGDTEIADDIETLAAVMRRHVDRHLARARIASGAQDSRADVSQVVDDIVGVLQRSPEGEELSWFVDAPDGLAARIDRDDLAEALGNLVDNAVRHATGRIEVSARKDGDRISILVADDGSGIPEERRGEALRRGGRLDASGPGAGLGLAIVTEIADSWGGTFGLEEAAPGLRAILSLPAAPKAGTPSKKRRLDKTRNR